MQLNSCNYNSARYLYDGHLRAYLPTADRLTLPGHLACNAGDELRFPAAAYSSYQLGILVWCGQDERHMTVSCTATKLSAETAWQKRPRTSSESTLTTTT